MEVTPVLLAEYAGLSNTETGQTSLSFAAQQAISNLGPGDIARVNCITACTSPNPSNSDSPCLYLRGTSGQCLVLPLPDYDARNSQRAPYTHLPTARLRGQHCSTVWVSSSGCFAAVETETLEGPALCLRDLSSRQETVLSHQALHQRPLVQAWVSDTGKALLVQSSSKGQEHFCLWCRREGNPDSPLPKQPVESWRQLPAVPSNKIHLRAAEPLVGKGSTGRSLDRVPEAAQLDQGTPDASQAASKDSTEDLAVGAEQRPTVTVAAGFADTPSGLCVCIAVADCCGTESAELCLRTLIAPVWPDAADAKVWRLTVVPLSGGSINGVGAAPVTGQMVGAPLQTMGSFEDIDLHQADALERGGSGSLGQNRPVCAMMRWQPGGRRDSSTVNLAAVLSHSHSKAWLAMIEAYAVTPAAVCQKVAWQPDSLRGGERHAPSTSSKGSGQIAGLDWLPDGRALAVMDQRGNLSFFDTAGRSIPITLQRHSLQAGGQHAAMKVLHESLWSPEKSPGQPGSTRLAICTYTSSANPAAARLAVLHGSQVTILSVRSMPDPTRESSSSPGLMQPTLNSASSADRNEFADITPAIELSRAAQAPVIKPNHGRLRTLRVLAACVGPPEVSLDDARSSHAGERFHAQKQHSLPETSPGKSPAGSGHVSPFRVPGAIRTRLSNALRRSGSLHPDSPTPPHRSQEIECGKISHTPRAPVPSPDSDERATNSLQPSRLAEGGRRANFSSMYETINPEQDRGPRYPGSPQPRALKAARLGSAGSSGSPRLLHAPKKSILRPRGSKAHCPSLEPSPEPPAACAEETFVSPKADDSPQQAAAAGQVRRNTEPGMASHASSGLAGESQNRQARGRALTGLPRLKSSTRDISAESDAAAPRSPTALQAKLRRLKAKWSNLADRSHALSKSNSKAATSAEIAKANSEMGSFAVSVTAAAPFTIIELQDGEEASVSDTAPESSDMGSSTTPERHAASAGRAADAPTEEVCIKTADFSADDAWQPIEQLEETPGMTAWEELGLPPGVNLWGPTVLELPESPSALSQSKAVSPELAENTAQAGNIRVCLMPARPIAEAMEAEASTESSQLSSGSLHLSSDGSSSRSGGGQDTAGSPTAVESTMQLQGNGLFETLTSLPTSPSLTDTTLLLSTARSDAAESKGPVDSKALAEVPKEAARLRFADDRALSDDTSAPSQQGQESLTLDQELSNVRQSPEDATELPSDASADAAGPSSTLSAGVAVSAVTLSPEEAVTQDTEKEGTGPGSAGGMHAVRECGPSGAQPKGPSGDLNEIRTATDGMHMDDGNFCEPAVLDRGEPTFEDSMRSQQQAQGSGWRAGQLLLPRKQAPPRAQPSGSSSPQRSCSPFGRLAYSRRAKPEQAQHATEDMAASGPGPLEKGMHEAEMGGYYLTTPDPLRTDPGLAVRIRRSASEQSAQSAAQRAVDCIDPLNCDTVQYVSSPAWRMNTLTALDMLRSDEDADSASSPHAHPGRQTAAKTTHPARRAWRSDAQSTDISSPESKPPVPPVQSSRGELHGRLASCAREFAGARASCEHGSQHGAEDGRSNADEMATPSERRLRKQKKGHRSLHSSSRHRGLSANGDRKTRDVLGVRGISAPDSATSSNEASATECELIKAIRCQNDARLLRPRFPPAAEDKPFALPRSDGLRLVDTDCKWGLNRAGRPPDTFWERSTCNPVRKVPAADNRIRLLRVELDAEPRRGLLRTSGKAHRAGKAQRSDSPGASPRPERARHEKAEGRSSDSRVMKELQEITAALKEMKANAATRSANPDKQEATPDSNKRNGSLTAAEKPEHQQKAAGSGAALLRLARQQRSPKSQSPPASKRASESGTGDASNLARHDAEICTENATAVQTSLTSSIQACNASAQKHAGQARQDTGQDGQGFKEPGQEELPAAQTRAAVEAGVQTTSVPRRVPVQAVLLSPVSPLQQNVDNSSEQEIPTPTAQELQALWKLREGLVSTAGQPLRSFTRVKDVDAEDSRDWPTNSPAANSSRHGGPGNQRLIHPSSPLGASWGSRHAQHIGSGPGSAATPKAKHGAQKSKESRDKELKAMAAQVTKLMVSLHDIEVLAMAVKSDAAASCKMAKKMQAKPRATEGAPA